MVDESFRRWPPLSRDVGIWWQCKSHCSTSEPAIVVQEVGRRNEDDHLCDDKSYRSGLSDPIHQDHGTHISLQTALLVAASMIDDDNEITFRLVCGILIQDMTPSSGCGLGHKECGRLTKSRSKGQW